jgi:nicotinate phosphoribosyltransferase
MAQIFETPLLNQLNFQTLIATKAARIRDAGRGQLLLEFGMRRGHDAGVTAGVRGALIGGADFSSHTGASCALGFPPKGTHAHSLVQAFMALGEGELGAFRAYAEVFPDDCILLVDTIDTLESGIPNAIKVFEELRRKGHQPVGIRLDSGDLAHLAVRAAAMLDDAGFPDAKIVLSNQLDEMTLWQITRQIEQEAGSRDLDANEVIGRLVYGVGTRLITSEGDAALDGVYKLVAIRNRDEWVPAIKISETPAKTLNPGDKPVWRLYDQRGVANADLLTVSDEDPQKMESILLQHPTDSESKRTVHADQISDIEPLLVDIMNDGRLVYAPPSIEQMRQTRDRDLDRLDPGVKRIINPHHYHVSLSQRLWDLKRELVGKARGQKGAAPAD